MRPPRGSRAQSSHLFCAPWGPATCPSAGATGCLRACQMRGDPGSGRGTCALLTLALLLSLPGARLRPGGGQGGRTAAAGQQRPRPGSALSRSRLCRASAAQGAFGKGFRGRSGSGLGRPARPLSLCAFPRPAPGPGACGGHSLPARQPDSLGPDCVLSRTRRRASDDVLDLPRASVSFPFIGDSNSTYPSGGVRVK